MLRVWTWRIFNFFCPWRHFVSKLDTSLYTKAMGNSCQLSCYCVKGSFGNRAIKSLKDHLIWYIFLFSLCRWKSNISYNLLYLIVFYWLRYLQIKVTLARKIGFSIKMTPGFLFCITTQVEICEKKNEMWPRLLVAMTTAAILDFHRRCLRVVFYTINIVLFCVKGLEFVAKHIIWKNADRNFIQYLQWAVNDLENSKFYDFCLKMSRNRIRKSLHHIFKIYSVNMLSLVSFLTVCNCIGQAVQLKIAHKVKMTRNCEMAKKSHLKSRNSTFY